MGYDDPYRDEDGEPLMDPDEVVASGDEIEEEDDWRRERSPTPVQDQDQDWDALKHGKPRKRLVKKSDKESVTAPLDFDDDEDPQPDFLRDDEIEDQVHRSTSKRKSGSSSSGRKEKKKHYGGPRSKSGKGGRSNDPEMKEMWDTVAGGDSEDDTDPTTTLEDNNFIDDTGVDPADRYASDNELQFNRDAPQAEEGEGEDDDEIDALFKSGKKKKKNEKTPGDIAIIVEQLMAELEVTAEEDAELNRHNKPAVNKLKKLPLLTQVLSKKQLQLEFLDHGVLGVLRTWLEPLPDGSLPNISIRTAILKILTDYPIDLEQYDRRDQLKKSNLGKVIMFLSKLDEETTSNRKLAKDLVDKWSRPIFNKSTRFEDMRSADEERVLYRRPASKKPANKASGMESRDDDFDIGQSSQGRKSVQPSSRQHASRPEALPMDFVVRPQSKIDPDEVRARARQIVQDQRRLKMNKKLQQLKAPKKKQLQATKLSVEGRGMVKFF